MKLLSKWGCDGSSGHSEYKQTPVPIRSETSSDEDEDDAPSLPPSDSHLFLFSLQPLSLVGTEETTGNEITLWRNKKPSSTKYCRPIKFLYIKETAEVIKAEVQKMRSQIEELEPLDVDFGTHFTVVHFELLQTMVDGKVINALTGTSSQVRLF